MLAFLAQNITFACTLPLYLMLHLFTSPTAGFRPGKGLVVRSSKVVIIVVMVVIGFALPVLLLSLPAPSMITLELKQIFMSTWQVFPMIFAILQYVLPSIFSLLGLLDSQDRLGVPRFGYGFAFAIASVTRVMALGVIGLNTFFPALFKTQFEEAFRLPLVMRPTTIGTSWKPSSVGETTLLLLHYDELCSGIALVIWTAALYFQTLSFPRSLRSWTSLLSIVVTTWVFSGFAGLGILAVWRRDEFLQRELLIEEDKKLH